MTDGPPDHYYKPEVDNFLRMFVERAPYDGKKPRDSQGELAKARAEQRQVFESQSRLSGPTNEIEEEHGTLHPVSIAAKMIGRRGFSPGTNAQMREILEKSYPRHESTGLYSKETMPVIVGLAHLNARTQDDVPVCLVEGDLTNIGAANEKLGRENTNKLMRKICTIVDRAPSEAGAQVHPVQVGGDELRFVTYGVKLEKLKKLLKDKVHPEINLLSAQYGVHDLQHGKAGKLPGFGGAFGVVDLAREHSGAEIRDKLNIQINAQKQDDGMLRFGLVDEAGIQRYIKEIYKPYLRAVVRKKMQEDGLSLRDAGHLYESGIQDKTEQLRELAEQTRQRWEELIGEGGSYHQLNRPRYKGESGDYSRPAPGHRPQNVVFKGFTGPREFFNGQKLMLPERALAKMPMPRPLTPAEKIPFYDTQVPSHDEDSDITRMRKTLSALGFNDIANAKTPFQWNMSRTRYELAVQPEEKDPKRLRELRMAIDLMHHFDTRDHASRAKAGVRMLEDAEAFAKRHDGIKIMQLEVNNLSGMNTLNYDIADAVLRDTHKRIQSALSRHHTKNSAHDMGPHIVDNIYHEGGGKFKIFVPPNYSDRDIREIADKIGKDVKENIADVPVIEFAKRTYAYVRKREQIKPPPGVSVDEMLEASQKVMDARLASLAADIQRELKNAPDPTQVKMSDILHPKDHRKTLGISLRIEKIRKGETVRQVIERMEMGDTRPIRTESSGKGR